MRHVSFAGKPLPENLTSVGDPNTPLCRFDLHSRLAVVSDEHHLEKEKEKENESDPSKNSALGSQDIGLAMKVIDLQEENIQLRQQIDDLRTYKDFYGKSLGTDYLFSSEKFFETWIQENMHKIFPELEIIERQPSASWPDGKFGRLDLLAMNKESKDLAIIEVKTRKRSKKSGYDQFVRYTSWVKRNIEMLKSRYSEFPIEPTINPQFIIITDYIDDEMKAICKDHEITLIHIFGGLGVEKAA